MSWMNLEPIIQSEVSQKERDTERGGEGDLYGESNMETYTTSKSDSQWEFAVCLRKLKQGSVST